jgi:carboxyl-terminal processing protease
MMRKVSLVLVGALLGASAVAAIRAPALEPAWAAGSTDTYRYLNLFGDVFERIRSDYVDKPNEKQLVEGAIQGMLSSLDPHSAYLDPKQYRERQVDIRGEFGGLGIEVSMEGGLIKVVSPIDDTPAAHAGILANDVITKIDGSNVEGMTLSQAVEKMRGPVGTSIVLTVQRKGAAKPLEVKLTRDIIHIRVVRDRVEGDNVGYIRIASFSEATADGLQKAIEDIQKKVPDDKLKGYVLDLRNNPGGLLDQAIQVVDDFIDRGEVVSTRGRRAEDIQRYNARPGDLTHKKPMIVLVNGGSASASEIVAGALQDHRRATILGTRSFGKGSVQTLITLGSNGALSLTTARYYTPCGRSIQARGITPDIVKEPNVPADLKGKDLVEGEVSMRHHLLGTGEKAPDADAAAAAAAAKEAAKKDEGGSSAYVPPNPKDDVQLQLALQLMRGTEHNPAFPSGGDKASPECAATASNTPADTAAKKGGAAN